MAVAIQLQPSLFPLLIMLLILCIAITCHYIDEKFNLHQPLLGFEVLEDYHTGYNLASTVYDVLVQYDVCGKLFCITSDNTSNNGTIAEHLQTKLAQIGG